MSARAILYAFLGWMAVPTTLYFAFPGWHLATWSAIGVSSAAAIVIGALRNRARPRAPWLLIAAGTLTFCLGDTTYNILIDVLGQANPFPSPADVLYLVMYPLVAAGLFQIVRARTSGPDHGGVLDALTLTAGLVLLSWIFLINPYLNDDHLDLLGKAVSVAYPLGDVLLMATVVRLFAGPPTRSPARNLIGLGAAGLLVADVSYGLQQMHGTWDLGGPTDLGWVLLYAAWGAAALHPSMAHLTEPARTDGSDVSNVRLGILAGASLIGPIALLSEALDGPVPDAAVISVISGLTFLLVLTRLSGLVTSHRAAIGRERGLRRAAGLMVAAADMAEVTDAARGAVAALLPPDTPHLTCLTVTDSERLDASEDQLRVRTVPTRELDPELVVKLFGFPSTLVCPLVLEDRPTGSPLVGTLYIGAAEPLLRPLRHSLEVIASQTALALERIALTNEVNQRKSEAYFRTLVHSTADVILIVDDEDEITYASPSADVLFGVAEQANVAELIGVDITELVHPHERSDVRHVLSGIRDGGPRLDGADWRVVGADQQPLQVEVACRDLRKDPTVRGLVLTLRDVTERRQLERELAHQAFHDSLTGLANRVLFQDRVQHAVTRATRDESVVGVLFIDIDDFKVINDTIGHTAGDELLVAVAERLSSALRAHDTAARLGGDEFAALIEDAEQPGLIEEIAERIINVLSKPFLLSTGELVNGAASVGVTSTMEAQSAEELLRHADLALFAAKGAGKGMWRRYQATVHTAMLERLELRSALDQAVVDSAFTLHYQPIVELDTSKVVGFEALVRWEHPSRGMIPPGQFIDVAEESGLIVPIGAWVVRQALRTLGEWRDQTGNPPEYISVNVSARQFGNANFVEVVRSGLADASVPAGALLLEITESLLLKDDEQISANLAALRELGVRIAIDDFGTGYSSLSYLRQFPIDVLKIDKSFIDDLAVSDQQRAVAEAIVRLADTLDLTVVAEGIEDQAQRDTLAEIGCPLGQGYLFSRPVPANEAARWLRHNRQLASS